MSLDETDYDRLVAIQEQMQELTEEAKNLVRMSGNKFEYERAKAYWLGYLDSALDGPKSPLLMVTMGDTLAALKPEGVVEDDEEEIEEDTE